MHFNITKYPVSFQSPYMDMDSCHNQGIVLLSFANPPHYKLFFFEVGFRVTQASHLGSPNPPAYAFQLAIIRASDKPH